MLDGHVALVWIKIWLTAFYIWFMVFCLLNFVRGMLEATSYKSTRGLRD